MAEENSAGADEIDICFYCGLGKPLREFSDEHIWPDALGGDFLPPFWRTRSVCAKCNSISGLFVDGAFIRGWAGSRERGEDALQYLSRDDPASAVMPLSYIGRLSDARIADDEIADMWVGPCGATIVHFRPKVSEDLWWSYIGGDPRRKKAAVGRAYIALASATEYWIIAALTSFKSHFKRATRRIVNMEVPQSWTSFAAADRADPSQAADLLIFDTIINAGRAGSEVHSQLQIDLHAGNRLLCKLGLALGCQLFGHSFGTHADGVQLRLAFREADAEKRSRIPIRGTGYYDRPSDNPLSGFAWPAGWVLLLNVDGGKLSLVVIAPSGAVMSILITDDSALIASLPEDQMQGLVWVTVPPLRKAVGPMSFANYVSHMVGASSHPELASMNAARIDPATLPPCDEGGKAEAEHVGGERSGG